QAGLLHAKAELLGLIDKEIDAIAELPVAEDSEGPTIEAMRMRGGLVHYRAVVQKMTEEAAAEELFEFSESIKSIRHDIFFPALV
ncbi:hypothetical protein, partial [Escherichia coli]|uniref:hypothetical protein n=1 Tax=Escherichia coli TaxID=562 RepID=UPI003D0013BB